MPKAKATPKAKRGVGQPTKKDSGYIVTSLRLLVEHNKFLRSSAAIEGLSFNSWAVHTLLKQARLIQKREK